MHGSNSTLNMTVYGLVGSAHTVLDVDWRGRGIIFGNNRTTIDTLSGTCARGSTPHPRMRVLRPTARRRALSAVSTTCFTGLTIKHGSAAASPVVIGYVAAGGGGIAIDSASPQLVDVAVRDCTTVRMCCCKIVHCMQLDVVHAPLHACAAHALLHACASSAHGMHTPK